MIAVLLAALVAAAPADVPPLGQSAATDTILEKYTEALTRPHTPRVLSFEYTIDQAGTKDIQQDHRVFRSGNNQRDEIIGVDGKKLDPPTVHIFLGRRNRYAIESLAPRPSAYAFRLVGKVRDAHHIDYVFKTTAHAPGAFTVTQVTIDGVTFMPNALSFATSSHHGSGNMTFVRADKYWIVSTAMARATYAKLGATERIVFSHYQFPDTLPPSTFATPRPLPSIAPAL